MEAIQQSRQESELYKALGEAVYKAQRQGGDQAAVDAAVTALDNHFAQVAQAAANAPAADGGASANGGASAAAPPPSASAPATPQEGNFTLDDM